MEKKYLIVNTGSASKKYALYSGARELCRVHFEKEEGKFVATVSRDAVKEKIIMPSKDFTRGAAYILDLFLQRGLIKGANEIEAVGMRIVAPGTYFLAHKRIDRTYIKKLEEAKARAPLHLVPMLRELGEIRKLLPHAHVLGVSDSAFHGTMEGHARHYSLPRKTAKKFDIERFGYHGISSEYVTSKVKELLGHAPEKMVICHLGSGSSIVAVKHGKSIDTSMGFTPLEGVPMGTRIGNIDAGAVIYLAQKLKLKPGGLEQYFNSKCGLLGLSEKTDDVRELLEREAGGDRGAKLALETFVYHIKKYIGAYTAVLDGLDVLVFTATIGERSWIMRKRICDGLEGMGITLNSEKNRNTVSADGFVQSDHGKVRIAVIVTDEMREIAEELARQNF